MYVRTKQIPPDEGNWYRYLVRAERKNDQVQQKVVKYLGKATGPDDHSIHEDDDLDDLPDDIEDKLGTTKDKKLPEGFTITDNPQQQLKLSYEYIDDLEEDIEKLEKEKKEAEKGGGKIEINSGGLFEGEIVKTEEEINKELKGKKDELNRYKNAQKKLKKEVGTDDELEIALEERDFVGWTMKNNHKHTAKSHGVYVPANIKDDEVDDQIAYMNKIEEKENTNIKEIKTAKTKEEAIEKEILKDDGDYY